MYTNNNHRQVLITSSNQEEVMVKTSEERSIECKFVGIATNLEISTVTFWEVEIHKDDFPIVVAVWYTVGSPGYSWGFQVNEEAVRYVSYLDEGYDDIYKNDEYGKVAIQEIQNIHQAVLCVALQAGLIVL